MSNDLTLIKFKVSDKYYGYPSPFIPDGSIVILIQNGEIKISKYHEPNDDNPFPSFSHPKEGAIGNEKLEAYLSDFISNKYPEYFLSDKSVILTCPSNIAEKIIW